MRVWVALFLVTVTLPGALGFQVFTTTIPNGARVPSPCQEGALWQGVGHLNFHGAGATNVFGADFSEHGNRWTRDICQLDSDGDGRNNGQELGDPNCTWIDSSGNPPDITTGITHPGICEPVSSAACQQKPVPQSKMSSVSYRTQQDWLQDVCKADGTGVFPDKGSTTTVIRGSSGSGQPSAAHPTMVCLTNLLACCLLLLFVSCW